MVARLLTALLAVAIGIAGLATEAPVAQASPQASDDRVIEVTPILPHQLSEIAISRDGRYVAYATGQTIREVWLFDVETRETTHVSRSMLTSTGSISFTADSSHLVFSNMLTVPLFGDRSDVFTYEIATKTITNLTEGLTSNRVFKGRLAADGNSLVAEMWFITIDYQRIHIVLFDLAAGTYRIIDDASTSFSSNPSISDDGTVISFVSSDEKITPEPKATDRYSAQPYLYFVESDTFRSVTPGTTGDISEVHLTPKGDELVFSSDDKAIDPRVTPSGQYGDQYHYDINTAVTTRITYDPMASGGTLYPLSPTGRWLPIFRGGNVNNPKTGTNIIDRKTGEEINLSQYDNATDARWIINGVAISKNGGTVAFMSNNSVTVYRRPKCKGRYATIDLAILNASGPTVGYDTADRIAGTDGDDVIDGGAGDDIICGYGGNDRLAGGTGNDLLIGKAGKDRLWGGPGNDTLTGDVGTDKLYGQAGNDTLRGSKGPDTLNGGPGNDSCRGGAGDDKLTSC